MRILLKKDFLNKTRKFKQNKNMKKRKKFQSKTDPLGSYTGVPENPTDPPQQDADDL